MDAIGEWSEYTEDHAEALVGKKVVVVMNTSLVAYSWLGYSYDFKLDCLTSTDEESGPVERTSL